MSDQDQLFEWPVTERPPRPIKAQLTVRVEPPWVLLATARANPLAHVPLHWDNPVASTLGSVRAACGAFGRIVTLDAPVTAPACGACLRISGLRAEGAA